LVVFGAVLIWGAIAGHRSTVKKPGYASAEEMQALRTVVAAVGWPIAKKDPRYLAFRMLRARLFSGSFLNGALTADDVAMIRPWIEQWLAGDLPHLLTPEYDDETRLPLLSYKARMQANGLWPPDEPLSRSV
jgi:hypothetical protein